MSRTYLLTIIILITVAATGFFIWRGLKTSVSLEKQPEVSIQLPETNKIATASGEKLIHEALDREIVVKTTLQDTIKKQTIDELKNLSAQLKTEPNYLQGWLQVGILRKFIGDYEGASFAWQYATIFRPNDMIAFSNLGDLYHYYLKDFPKAEKYLRKAVDLKPDYIAGYKNLYDLYHLSYKEKENLTIPILLEGIEKNPNDYYLRAVLGSYYEEKGDKVNARKYIEEALKYNPPQVIKEALERELNSLQ